MQLDAQLEQALHDLCDCAMRATGMQCLPTVVLVQTRLQEARAKPPAEPDTPDVE